MDAGPKPLGTGLPGLDRMVRGVLPGDNIVWQVDAIEDYAGFVAVNGANIAGFIKVARAMTAQGLV